MRERMTRRLAGPARSLVPARGEEVRIPDESVRDMREFTEPDTLVVIGHWGGEFVHRLDQFPDERADAEIVRGLDALVQTAKAGVVGETAHGEGDPCLG